MTFSGKNRKLTSNKEKTEPPILYLAARIKVRRSDVFPIAFFDVSDRTIIACTDESQRNDNKIRWDKMIIR